MFLYPVQRQMTRKVLYDGGVIRRKLLFEHPRDGGENPGRTKSALKCMVMLKSGLNER
jgi:hypothetical protein